MDASGTHLGERRLALGLSSRLGTLPLGGPGSRASRRQSLEPLSASSSSSFASSRRFTPAASRIQQLAAHGREVPCCSGSISTPRLRWEWATRRLDAAGSTEGMARLWEGRLPNLLQNGGFESGFTGWTCLSSAVSLVSPGLESPTASLVAAPKNAQESDFYKLRQKLTVQPGHVYLAGAYLQSRQLRGLGATVEVHTAGDGSKSTWRADGKLIGTEDWTLLAVLFQAPSDTREVWFFALGSHSSPERSRWTEPFFWVCRRKILGSDEALGRARGAPTWDRQAQPLCLQQAPIGDCSTVGLGRQFVGFAAARDTYRDWPVRVGGHAQGCPSRRSPRQRPRLRLRPARTGASPNGLSPWRSSSQTASSLPRLRPTASSKRIIVLSSSAGEDTL